MVSTTLGPIYRDLTVSPPVDNALSTAPKGNFGKMENTTTYSHRRVGKRLRILPLLIIFSGASIS